ncbi:phospholipase D-like domain-containing protein [Allosphingosinicella indica]|uniref:Phospholipase D n=1 Tax=Allosphingosinicella indica TaxID=941907 RepID=A0A1X7G5K0_9SPHN|nr:phosphatidylserine/phosphatidylglycerophosphate/cardiolipin synthase family protein [Allosphingosinicella indica]SMF64187.1 cardiolipin synthase [Allosphingosinicella indica]
MSDAKPKLTAEVEGNRLTLLPDGPERLEALIALIDGAERTLRLLYYIFDPDESGRRVRDAIVRAVDRGVTVWLLVDGFGTKEGSDGFFKPLADGQCHFCRFVPRFGRRYLLRNHQKLALADEKVVLVGGFNVGDDYFGTVEEGAWRDIGLCVAGDGVACLADYFDSLFEWAHDPKSRIRSLRRMLKSHSKQMGRIHWLFGGPTRRLSPWAKAVLRDMRGAKRMDMIAAYFAPSRALLRRIYGVARRGQSRVVTAAKSDNTATIGAARYTYWRMLKRGVEVYEYEATKLHSKLIIADDVVHIGSANFDMRSLYLNLEMMLRVEDAGFAEQMRGFFAHELEGSRRITLEAHMAQRTIYNRFKWWVAHFIVAVMDYNVSRRLNFGLDGR